jgi:hypothetical protein
MLDLPLAVFNQKTSQTIFFFGEDYIMKPTAKEAKEAKESSGTNYCLSLEECLECFDERLLQCQEYTRRKVKQEIEMKEMSKNVSKQLDA